MRTAFLCAPLWGLVGALALQAQPPTLGLEHESGQSVTAAFEGWFPNADGTFSILFGYLNRNAKQELDIPVGPANQMELSGYTGSDRALSSPDQGQPTHFLTGRQWGIFTVTVPKDFGAAKMIWRITANGATTQVPGNLATLWQLNPFQDANGNTPPWIGFEESGPFVNGPKGHSEPQTARVGEPLPLPLWVADDASVIPGATRPRTAPVTLFWSKFRGPGPVAFSNDRPPAETTPFAGPPHTAFQGKAATTATFSEPGEYILRVLANDWSGEGGRGFQCCWSNAQVVVSVK
jgi:hypothetical protein